LGGGEKFSRSGVHQLTHPECGKKYAGQTGRLFHKRHDEHLQYFKYWKLNSAFAKHVHDSVKVSWAAASRCEGFPTFRELMS
jgi:hypothetical protein